MTSEAGLIHVAVAAPVAAVSLLRAFTVQAEAVEADESRERSTDRWGQP